MAIKQKERNQVKQKSDNQLPEWAKGTPEDTNQFSMDFAHPDAPAVRPGRTVSLDDIQMFDVVHSKNVIGLVDRRGVGRKKFKGIDIDEETEVDEDGQDGAPIKDSMKQESKSSITASLRKIKEEPKEEPKDEVKIGDLVLMIRGKVIGSGDLDDVSEVILTLVSKDESITDEEITLFQRIPLTVVLDRVSSKY